MRLFVAISLSDEAKDALTLLQRELPAGRPVSPDNMHLTLAFLDDHPVEVLEALHEELLTLASPPFKVSFKGISSFGHVMAVEAADCPELAALHRKVQTAARRAGIVLPRRRFRPHITIARFKPKQRGTVQHLQCSGKVTALQEMLVTGFTLYQSTLRPDGARHDVLEHYTF